MKAGELERLRQQLIQECQEILERLKDRAHYGLASSMRDNIGELSLYDNHPADVATELFERGKDTALNDQDERRLEAIDAALKRMDQGTYGTCSVCHALIPIERLEANPAANTCVTHEPGQIASNRRPAEEAILAPPFDKHNYDTDDSETEFDSEDAWQAVEQYGTSNPPDVYREGKNYNDLGNEPDERRGTVEDMEGLVTTGMAGAQNEDGTIDVIDHKGYDRLQIEDDGGLQK